MPNEELPIFNRQRKFTTKAEIQNKQRHYLTSAHEPTYFTEAESNVRVYFLLVYFFKEKLQVMCIKLLKLSVSDIASCAHPSESVSLFTSHPRYNISFSKHIFLYIDISLVNLT